MHSKIDEATFIKQVLHLTLTQIPTEQHAMFFDEFREELKQNTSLSDEVKQQILKELPHDK